MGDGVQDRYILSAAEAEKDMTITLTPVSTQEKLQRAKDASARVAQLSTEQKNAILLAMADASRRTPPVFCRRMRVT